MALSTSSSTSYNYRYELEFPWVKENAKCRYSAKCTWCNSTINIKTMGKTALKSHAKSTKHLSFENLRTKSVSMHAFLKATPDSNEDSAKGRACQDGIRNAADCSESPVAASSSCSLPLKNYLLSEAVSKAEVIWCLHCVTKHVSFRSAASGVECFADMFPDSAIAAKMQMHKTKVSYTIVHGLAPHFKQLLQVSLQNATHITVGFDESLNKVSKKQQMDIHVRFWDEAQNEVTTRYYSSVFLGRSTAGDLLEGLKSTFTPELIKKIIQLSMDGPNVNLKLWKMFTSEIMENPDAPILLNIGTCSLHSVHGAFKASIKKTGWDIVEFLRAVYYLFKDSPARRAQFIYHTESTLFPLKFCSIRWVENVSVAQRALVILPSVIKFVNVAEKEKLTSVVSSHNFGVVSQAIKDKFLPAKLAFFVFVAEMVEPFLKEFQSNGPMVPFLYNELESLVNSIFQRVVKTDVIEAAKSLKAIDLANPNNLVPVKKVDLGFSTRNALKKIAVASELQILQFHKDCQAGLLQLLQKVMERSPLQYKLTKALTCFDPGLISTNIVVAEERLSSCLEILVANNWVAGTTADKMRQEYKKFCAIPVVMASMKSYCRSETRVDHFWSNHLQCSGQQFLNLVSLAKIILIMSNGNAFVERGFSINSDCLLENQAEESLVALRLVQDAVMVSGGVRSVQINKSLVHSARNAHTRYMEQLEKRRAEENKTQAATKIKKREAEERKMLETKKAKLFNDTMKEITEIDEKLKFL